MSAPPTMATRDDSKRVKGRERMSGTSRGPKPEPTVVTFITAQLSYSERSIWTGSMRTA